TTARGRCEPLLLRVEPVREAKNYMGSLAFRATAPRNGHGARSTFPSRRTTQLPVRALLPDRVQPGTRRDAHNTFLAHSHGRQLTAFHNRPPSLLWQLRHRL